jgi:excisionase family DNA binding protein
MPAGRLLMRQVREVLRLKHACGAPERQIATSVGIGRTAVGEYLRRAAAIGITWPVPDGMDDAELERRLFTPPSFDPPSRPTPDWAYVHAELRRRDVTLMLLWEEYCQLASKRDPGWGARRRCAEPEGVAPMAIAAATPSLIAFVAKVSYGEQKPEATGDPMLALLDQAESIVADEAEAAIAKTAAASLARAASAGQGVQLVLREQPNVVVPLPARAVEVVLTVLCAMAERRPISVIPHEAELTTQQAADYLNVSRPFLIGLIDGGEIPHRMVGRHRRVRFADLLVYERASAKKRKQALAEMAAEARRLELD